MKKLALIFISLQFAACGRVEHKVSGSAETKSTIDVNINIDFSICDELWGEDRRQCILNLTEVAKMAAESQGEDG